jgi:hypothetical protein
MENFLFFLTSFFPRNVKEKGSFVVKVYNVRTGEKRDVHIYSMDPEAKMGISAVYGMLKHRDQAAAEEDGKAEDSEDDENDDDDEGEHPILDS